MRVGVIGINHKLAHLKLRESLANVCLRRFGAGRSSHGEHSFILLSTCNRTEIYFCSEDLANTHTYVLNILCQEVSSETDDFNQKLYSYFGYDCFTHLSRVTAGLDSAVIAETEIQGQVKVAYETASTFSSLPGDLHFLFQKALSIGKQVRTKLCMGRGMPGLEDAIFNLGAQIFSNPYNARILFIGASDINRKILTFFHSKGLSNITLCNRSAESVSTISASHPINVLEWDKLSDWHHYNWVICATKAPKYLITKNALPALNVSRKLIIDLSVPRNVEPSLARDSSISLLNIDQVNSTLKVRKQKMQHEVASAEKLIFGAAKRHIDLFAEKDQYRRQLMEVVKG